MKKLVLSAIVLTGFLFTSCDDKENEDNDGKVDVTKTYLPLKISTSDYTTSFSYNDKGQVVKIAESDGYEYVFKYNGKQLVEIVEDGGAVNGGYKTVYTFTQSGNTVTLNMEALIDGQKYQDKENLLLDAKGNLSHDGYFTYTYDANGNVIKMASDDGEATLTYDAKNGIFKNVNLPQWVLSYILSYQINHVNNVLTFSFVSEDVEDNNSGTAKYEYNADGYPTKATMDSDDDDREVQIIEYTKK